MQVPRGDACRKVAPRKEDEWAAGLSTSTTLLDAVDAMMQIYSTVLRLYEGGLGELLTSKNGLARACCV